MQLEEFIEKIPDRVALKVRFHKRCLILAKELYHASEPDKITPHIGEQRKARLYAAIIFLGFALESFINEIGLEYCKKDFEITDRLSASDKWFIIPKLKSKKSLKKGEEPFQSIITIFKYRNLFAHFRPQFRKYLSEDYEDMRRVDHNLVIKLYNKSVEAMRTVAKEFNLKDSDWLIDEKL